MDEKINVLFTGDGVVCDWISDDSYKMAIDIYKRDLGIWLNYPVNDFLQSKLALVPIEKLPISNIKSIFYNPMGHVYLSKIALATGGENAYSPETYDSDKSLDRVLNDQFCDISETMKVFATYSRHMENTWAKVGPLDAPEFYELGHQDVIDFKWK